MTRRLVAAGTSAAATALAAALLARNPPGGPDRWARRNHRDEPVTLLEGPAYAAGAAAGVLLAPGLSSSSRLAATLAVTAAAGLGAYDDLSGDSTSRGLRGHLGALRRGEVTTGAVKVLGLAVTGVVTAALLDLTGNVSGSQATCRRAGPCRLLGRGADVLVAGALVAGTANLVNLLDLRPGRALKVVTGLGLATAALAGPDEGGGLAAAAFGSAAASLAADLAERTMLGDTGANAAGALLGTAWAGALSRRGRVLALAAVAGLTLASERVSFSAVIERTPALRALDQLGRRPPSTST